MSVFIAAVLIVLHQGPHVPPAARVELPRRLVFANHYGLQWSVISGVPSGEVSLFLGSSLRPRPGRLGRWSTALGYELGIAVGGAERSSVFFSWGGNYGIAYHRHYVSALGYGGPSDRLYYQFGGGVLLWRSTPVALEADARLGVVLGVRRPGRIKVTIGGEARIVGILDGVPLPQFGVFAGFFIF